MIQIIFLFDNLCINSGTLQLGVCLYYLTMREYRICKTERHMFYIQRGYRFWKWIVWFDVAERIYGRYKATKLFYSLRSVKDFLYIYNEGSQFECQLNF